MNKLGQLLMQFSKQFVIESQSDYKSSQNTKIITKEIPNILIDKLNLNNDYKVYGSVGSGRRSEIPWIGILDNSITKSTEKGYYLVLLLDKNLQNVYIGLSVGWTQFKEEYGAKEGKIKIRAICDHYAQLIKNKPSDFKEGLINLEAENTLGKGYERGSILSKKYSISNIKDEEIVENIKIMLDSYEELKEIIGNSILNLEIDFTEHDRKTKEFKKEIAIASLNENIEESIEQLILKADQEHPEVREKLKREIIRNKKFADFIKNKAKYICEICSRLPFTQKNGKLYAEADHIIPLGGKLKGLDSINNMRCLCPQCHAIITHGSEEEIGNLIELGKLMMFSL